MNMKDIARMMAAFTTTSTFSTRSATSSSDPLSQRQRGDLERKRHEFDLKRKQKQGLKLFTINGISVFALNQRNAIRKINNQCNNGNAK